MFNLLLMHALCTVSTVDLLLAEDPQQMQSRGTNKVLSITWQQTDSILDAVTARSLSTWTPGTHVLLETVQEKLAQFREKNLRRELNPVKAIDIFTNICNNIEREFRALSGFPVASGMAPTSHLLPFSSSSYLLFNRGMAKRLAEIALGTYYFRSSGLMNATNYFDLHYSSKELMKAAFKYNPRAQLRYFELQIQDPQVEQALLLVGSDILNGGVNRSSNVYAARYLDGVKQEIATLLLAKDFLNTTISNQLRQIEKDSFKKLNFNLCVSSIALAIVLMSVVMTCCTFTKISSPSDKEDEVKTIPPLPLTSERQVESMMGYVGSVETIFSPTFTANDRINFLPTTLYNKPHCYL